MGIVDRDRGAEAAATPAWSERWICRRSCGEAIPASCAFVEGSVPSIQLNSVTLLELVIEVLEELVEGRRGLVRELGEEEWFEWVGHVSEPLQRGAAPRTPAC